MHGSKQGQVVVRTRRENEAEGGDIGERRVMGKRRGWSGKDPLNRALEE